MDGGGGPSGPGCGRDLREFIPGKNKTVRFDNHPLWSALAFFLSFSLLGILLLWAGLREVVESAAKHDFTVLGPTVVFILFGGILIFPSVLMLYDAIDSAHCLTMEALSDRLNVPEETVRQLALEKGITVPRYQVKGRDFYHPKDFDSLRLLRASGPSVKVD